MKSYHHIQQQLIQHKSRLMDKYPIKSMALFGSYSREDQNQESDVDVMVEFNGDIGIRFIDLAEELEDILGCKVDLVSKEGIKEKYYQVIKKDLKYV